jgi:branched-chain amino acid transport system substrate-binding protein
VEHTLQIKGLSWFAALVLVCGLFSIAPSEARAAEPKPINVGVTADFSGISAVEGLQEFPAFEMAMKEINAAGGINGRPIKLFVLDNGGDPAKTVGACKILKDRDQVVAIYYLVNSAAGLAAKAWAEQNHVPIITSTAISDKLIQSEGKTWFFRATMTNSELIEATLMRIKEMGLKKIGFSGTTMAFGTDALNVIQRLNPKYGFEFVGSVLCEPKSKDLTIQARKLRNMGPEGVILQHNVAEQMVWASNLKTLGWNPVSTTALSFLTICLDSSPKELYEGWQAYTVTDLSKPELKTIWDKYAAYTGKRLQDDSAPRAWDAAHVLAEAIKLSGNPDSPEAIRDGFYKIKNLPIVTGHQGSTASFEIGRDYMIRAKDFSWVTVKAGKVVPVASK